MEHLLKRNTQTMDKIYARYDYMAIYYANKLWNNTDSALEKDDLIQELRIRLFTSIQTYLLKWKNYKDNGGVRPVPIEFYLRTVMVNKSRDLIKELQSNGHVVSLEDSDMHFGTTALEIRSTSKLNIFLGAQNLIELFRGRQKSFMQLYFLNDFEIDKVVDYYKGEKSKIIVEDKIKKGIEKLKKYLKEDIEDAQEFCYIEIQEQ